MQRSKRVLLVLVTAVVLVAIALLVRTPEWFVASTRANAESADEERVAAATDLAAAPALEERASGEARRSLEPERTPSESSVAASSPLDGRVVVRVVVVEDEHWLQGSLDGRLHWSDDADGDAGGGASYEIASDSVTLPRAPTSIAEFTGITIANFALRPVALQRRDDTTTPFELRVAFEPGATLVWAPSVARADQRPVDVVVGGHAMPTDMAGLRMGTQRGGFVDVRQRIELPMALPRVAVSTVVWVGAPSFQWRSYTVEPSDTRVEVALDGAATVRVLHEAPSDAQVVVRALPSGRNVHHAIVDASPVEFTRLPSGRHLVWIDGADGEPLSHTADVELSAGATTEIDLRAAAALDGLGGVRVFVRVTSDVIALAPNGLVPGLRRLPADGAAERWAGPLRRIESTDRGVTYEALGLTPGRHGVDIAPFAAWSEFDVHAGEITEIEVDLSCVGFVRFDLPSDAGGGILHLALDRIDAAGARGRRLSRWPPDDDPSTTPIALVCGAYAASVIPLGGRVGPSLVSDPFTVVAGATVTVPLRTVPLDSIRVEAVDAATGAKIAFDMDFWSAVRAVDSTTGAVIAVTMSFSGGDDGYTTAAWTVPLHDGNVRVHVPEHAAWTFEPLEPLALVDGATITLRATAK